MMPILDLGQGLTVRKRRPKYGAVVSLRGLMGCSGETVWQSAQLEPGLRGPRVSMWIQ